MTQYVILTSAKHVIGSEVMISMQDRKNTYEAIILNHLHCAL